MAKTILILLKKGRRKRPISLKFHKRKKVICSDRIHILFKAIVHPEMEILSSLLTPNLYEFLSFVENKR